MDSVFQPLNNWSLDDRDSSEVKRAKWSSVRSRPMVDYQNRTTAKRESDLLIKRAINNGHWTKWSAIWAEIIQVISKSNERAAQVRFEITSIISAQNCTTWGSITTLLHPFLNRPNTGLGHFKYFVDAVLSRIEIKFIHFWGGNSKSFGNKSSKICHMILFVYHFPAIWLVTLNKPWNLIGCFVFSVASSLAEKKDAI